MPEDVHVKAAEIREEAKNADTQQLLNDLLRDTHTLGRMHRTACDYVDEDCEDWYQYRALVYREEMEKRLKEESQLPISREDHLGSQLCELYAGKWVYLDINNNILGSGSKPFSSEELHKIGARTNHFVSKGTVLAPGVLIYHRASHP